jgi:hypothetical protein
VIATLGALALAGGGVAAYVVAGGKHDDGVTTCASQTSSCDGLKQTVRTWDTLALGAWIGAAAVGTLAIVLWTSPSSPSAPSTSARLVVVPGGAGLAGSF